MTDFTDAPHDEVEPEKLIAYFRARLKHEVKLRKYTEGKLLEAQQKIVDLAARGK